MVVAGISEWARRVRELRKSVRVVHCKRRNGKGNGEGRGFGPPRIDDVPNENRRIYSTRRRPRPGSRFSVEHSQRLFAEIRRPYVTENPVEYLRTNFGKKVSGEELRYVSGNQSDWARRVRELRTELGWQVVTKTTGMPELPVGVYLLASNRQAPEHDRFIKDSVRREVLLRDEYKCRDCGWHHEKWNPSDPRHLEAHHVIQHKNRGENAAENLITLCNVCHDKVHANSKR